MKLQTIETSKIQTSEFFIYPNYSQLLGQKNDHYEPLKVLKQKKHYLLVDGYARFQQKAKNWKCLVFPESEFFFLWESCLLDKFWQGRTNWILIAQMLEKIAVHFQKTVVEIFKRSNLRSIIPHSKFLNTILEMARRKSFLLKILPAESWSIQNYKIFCKNTDQEIALLAEKLSFFRLNFLQYKKILETFYDLKKLKKFSLRELLETLIEPKMSFSDFQKKLFTLRNPVASKIFEDRKKALASICLPAFMKVEYNDDLEQPFLFFICKTKNIKDWAKLLYFFKNEVLYQNKQIKTLYQLL